MRKVSNEGHCKLIFLRHSLCSLWPLFFDVDISRKSAFRKSNHTETHTHKHTLTHSSTIRLTSPLSIFYFFLNEERHFAAGRCCNAVKKKLLPLCPVWQLTVSWDWTACPAGRPANIRFYKKRNSPAAMLPTSCDWQVTRFYKTRRDHNGKISCSLIPHDRFVFTDFSVIAAARCHQPLQDVHVDHKNSSG